MPEGAGLQFSGYRVGERIGEGGMGVVYRASDLHLARDAAIKFFVRPPDGEERLHARFLREARAAAALNHRAICTVYRIGTVEDERGLTVGDGEQIDAGTPFIAMELVEGSSLDAVLAESGPLPAMQVVDVALQIAEALAAAHAAGFVHRDLKPGNVMLLPNGRVKILDFGLARPVSPFPGDGTPSSESLTEAGTVLGTTAYMSPEQLEGRDAGTPSDVFSLGSLIYEMATARRPFEGDTVAATAAKILETQPEPLEKLRVDLPGELIALVAGCQSKSAKDRPTATELVARLQALRATLESGERPVVDRGKARGRRARWPVAVAAIALALVAAVFSTWQLRGTATPVDRLALAVLPLVNASADAEDTNYLSMGVAEGLRVTLTAAGFRLTPSSTVALLSGDVDSPERVLDWLKVDVLVYGQLTAGDEELSVELAVAGPHPGEVTRFTSSAPDMYELARAAARQITEQLLGPLSDREDERIFGAGAPVADALDLYWQGAHQMKIGGRESFEIAAQRFEQALRLDPELAEAYVGLGAVNSSRYFYGWGGFETLDAAEASYRKALAIDPGSLAAHRGMIHVLEERGLSEATLRQAQLALQSGEPDDPEVLQVRGEGYFLGGLPDRAVDVFNVLIDKDPRNPGAYWYRACAAAWSRQWSATIEYGQEYIELFGDDGEIHTWMGVAHHSRGELELALARYQKAMDLFGDDPNLYAGLYLGLLFEQLGEPGKAREQWVQCVARGERLLQDAPDNPRVLAFLEVALALLGDRERYEEVARRLDAVAGDVGYFLSARAVTLVRMGRPEQAAETLRASLEHGETFAFAQMFGPVLYPGIEEDPVLGPVFADLRAANQRLRAIY